MDVADTRPLFVSGRCALNLDWGDVGPLSIDKSASKVIGKWGAVITPGSKQVLNWDTGKLEACTTQTCPNAINGVNHAPYAAFGGWSGGINVHAKDKVKDAAYAFFSYMSQSPQSKIDVTIGKTGFNPYRKSHFSDLGPWLDSGMSKEEATSYLGAIQDSLNSPNMILDLRVPQNQKYQQVVLDEALSRYLSGEIDEKTAISTIESGWNDLNDQIGKDTQLSAYKSTLGLQR
jgi:multiple sugar transport system substrate-binding protein